VDNRKQVPIIYNLFPRLAGTLSDWHTHIERAVDMHFNWLFINPIFYTGFSGSLYAIKEHYRLNPDFLPPDSGDGIELLKQLLDKCLDLGILPMIDLVINHTARDCPLTVEHPEWYLHDEHGEITSPYAVDPDDPGKVTVWGDLAEIDNRNSTDKEDLWKYWADMVAYYQRLGFKGFRCDAAYKVPAGLWSYLIKEASSLDPSTIFFAETLGCTEAEALALRSAGLHFFFNSSKWWDFEQPWCVEQHEKFGNIAPSISFPETHDTTRLAQDTNGNEAVQRQRYAFAAVFSAGLMAPIGYEYGFRKKTDVVSTRPSDWETPLFDIQHFIKRTNRFKLDNPLFQNEGMIKAAVTDRDVTVLERQSDLQADRKAFIMINKKWDNPVPVDITRFTSPDERHRLYYPCRDETSSSGVLPAGTTVVLGPAEIAILVKPQ
jgi:starch synthase (maltosyl-transferring)